MYGLFGKFTAQPGQRDMLLGHLLEAAAQMTDVEGCLIYIAGRASDDADGIWVSEVWRSQKDHQGSLALPATQALITVARPLIAGMSGRVEYEPLGGKGLKD